MTETTDVHTLAGAYALDALSEIERVGFARHVATCAACATEVAELTETAARLGAVTAMTPPPGLRSAVLADISRTRQVSTNPRVRPAAPGSAQQWRRRTLAAAAAALVAIGGIGAVWTVEENRLGTARQQASALQSEQDHITSVLTARDVRLRSATVDGGGRLTVATSPSTDEGVVVVADMPPPPPGKAYQLWLIEGATPTSAGVMAAGARTGTAYLGFLGHADHLGVTLEPAGGSTAPTEPVIAGVALA
jgi:anti-sigma-K factor RskA